VLLILSGRAAGPGQGKTAAPHTEAEAAATERAASADKRRYHVPSGRRWSSRGHHPHDLCVEGLLRDPGRDQTFHIERVEIGLPETCAEGDGTPPLTAGRALTFALHLPPRTRCHTSNLPCACDPATPRQVQAARFNGGVQESLRCIRLPQRQRQPLHLRHLRHRQPRRRRRRRQPIPRCGHGAGTKRAQWARSGCAVGVQSRAVRCYRRRGTRRGGGSRLALVTSLLTAFRVLVLSPRPPRPSPLACRRFSKHFSAGAGAGAGAAACSPMWCKRA
jgi:hypothetical protein